MALSICCADTHEVSNCKSWTVKLPEAGLKGASICIRVGRANCIQEEIRVERTSHNLLATGGATGVVLNHCRSIWYVVSVQKWTVHKFSAPAGRRGHVTYFSGN